MTRKQKKIKRKLRKHRQQGSRKGTNALHMSVLLLLLLLLFAIVAGDLAKGLFCLMKLQKCILLLL